MRPCGEDFGVRQDAVDHVEHCPDRPDQLGAGGLPGHRRSRCHRRADDHRLTTTLVDGVKLDELVGLKLYGDLPRSALAAMDRGGTKPGSTRAVIQGFGSMGGGHRAVPGPEAGVRVVGIADVHGVVANPDGLDVERSRR